jgi:hypothetical protein
MCITVIILVTRVSVLSHTRRSSGHPHGYGPPPYSSIAFASLATALSIS